MNIPGWQSRLLVPRWRSLLMTAASGELGSASSASLATTPDLSPDFLVHLERWNLSPTLVTAAELVESAILSAREMDGVSAAQTILDDESTAAPLLKAQAASLLLRAGMTDKVPERYRRPRSTDAGQARRALRIHPRDALAWVELAFAQTVAGHPRAAEQSMAVALQLSPHNRHVLRSASRLLLHLGKKDQAHDLLVRNVATRSDPWLVAAEIALAEVAERDPRFYKTAFSLLDNKSFSPHHLTELAGAAGTRELIDGNRKKAKRLFVQSVIAPTGSSLAQAEWATPTLGVEIIETKHAATATEPFEANALHLYREGQFSEVPESCEKWSEIEPFSIRPFEFGSIAAGNAELFGKAMALASEGLRRRPSSPLLLNCFAFAAASKDQTDDAADALRKVNVDQAEPRIKFLTLANLALTSFRGGSTDEGAILYRTAIEGFARAGFRANSATARVYFAREALRAQLPNAKVLVKEAQDAVRSFPAIEAARLLRKLEISIGEKPRHVPDYITPPGSENAAKPASMPAREIKWTTPGWKGFRSR